MAWRGLGCKSNPPSVRPVPSLLFKYHLSCSVLMLELLYLVGFVGFAFVFLNLAAMGVGALIGLCARSLRRLRLR